MVHQLPGDGNCPEHPIPVWYWWSLMPEAFVHLGGPGEGVLEMMSWSWSSLQPALSACPSLHAAQVHPVAVPVLCLFLPYPGVSLPAGLLLWFGELSEFPLQIPLGVPGLASLCS